MSLGETYATPLSRGARGLSQHSWRILIFGGLLFAASAFVPDPTLTLLLGVAAGTVMCLLMLMHLVVLLMRRTPARLAKRFAAHDPVPCFLSDVEGQVSWRNKVALQRFEDVSENPLSRALAEHFANPAPVIYRQLARAQNHGEGSEEIVTRKGRLRINVHRLGRDSYFWRFDDLNIKVSTGIGVPEIPVLKMDANGAILSVNQAAREFLGAGSKRFRSLRCDRQILRPGGRAELLGPDGPVPVRVISLANGDGFRAVSFVPVEQSLGEDGTAFFDTLPVALLRLDLEGRILMANRLARDFLGDPSGQRPLSDVLEGLGRSVLDWVQEVADNRAASRIEVLRVRRQDRELFVQIALKRIVQDGAPGLVAVMHDATEMKTLEAQFVQSQKMQAIGQLAGGVAHDFNNLLTAISGHCDLLLLRHEASDPDFSDLMQIHQNANRAASLVGQLLAFSRKQTLKLELVDLHDTLTDLTHLLNRLVGERIRLSVSHDPNLAPIRADKRQLEQVIMNLVVNARDAMPEGGEIRIETAFVQLNDELRRDRAVVAPGDYVSVRVNDEGMGIPKDKLTKVFEPFFTTKGVGEGTGLGLSTAYGIVKQSGGYIFIDSTVGIGTSFTLYFPAHHADEIIPPPEPEAPIMVPQVAPPPAPSPKPAVPIQGRGEGVILLVEDEAPVRAFASRALRMRGYTVLEAENAEQALKTLDDDKIDVDVFVTDVVMPGMDGPSWVRIALKSRPDTRVVFVSGYAEDDFADTQARIPNSVFLPKPFSLSELTSTVREQLH